MTKEQNIAFAKKHLVLNIYSSTKLENLNITYPKTQTLLQGVNITGVSLSDIEKIINLRDAWKYVLEKPSTQFDLNFICKVNEYIARNESYEWGILRDGKIGIAGTQYIPPIPDEKENIKFFLEKKALHTIDLKG